MPHPPTIALSLCAIFLLCAPVHLSTVTGTAAEADPASLRRTTTTTPATNTSTTQCPEILATKCTCGIRPYEPHGRPTYITNCTGAGFTGDAQLYLQQISNETEVLIFTGNDFPELPANLLLLNKTYDQLHTVDLSNNNISTIHGKAFHNMKSVRFLSLNDNNLTIANPGTDYEAGEEESLHPRMLSPLKNLEKLHLKNAFDHRRKKHGMAIMSALNEVFRMSNVSNVKEINLESNGLTTIGYSDFFCVLPRLQHIKLAYNSMTRYRINASCLPWLSSIDVSANFISTVDNRSIEYIKSSGAHVGKLHLNFSANPFRCDCSLLDFFRFVTAANSETADPRLSPKFENLNQFQCSLGTAPVDIMGKYFDDLNEQDFDCGLDPYAAIHDPKIIQERTEAVRRYRHYITLSYIILVFLLLLLAFLIGVLVYTNRVWLLATWNYFLVELNPKSDYTALDKDGPASEAAAPGAVNGDSNGRQVNRNRKEKTNKRSQHIRMREFEEDEGAVAEEQV